MNSSNPVVRRLAVAALLVAFVSAGSAGSAGTTEGDGMIYCLANVGDTGSTPCDREFRGSDEMWMTTGNVTTVTLTVSWTPAPDGPSELILYLHGNPYCTYLEGEPPCGTNHVAGPSPLTVTLTGESASNWSLQAFVHLKSKCSFENPPPTYLPVLKECDGPPVEIVQDQPFHYVWTVE